MGLVSKECIKFVKGFEGFEPYTKNDMVGVPTLGYGMTGNEIKGINHVTEVQASNMLEELINKNYALPIKNNLDSKGVKLKQNEFDALTSMAYNVGVGGLLGSTLYRNVCSGNRDRNTITSNFRMWCKAGGRTVQGLLRRRTEEAQMFFGSGNVASETSKTANTVNTGNSWIRRLQAECNKQGFSKQKVDGWYGENTLNGCPLVKQGARGNITRLLQEKLNKLTYNTNGIDGIYGSTTHNAIFNYQSNHGLSADGICGKDTWRKIIQQKHVQ